jgi:glycosyltransferase involved in cell wall biosynthesis
VEVSTIPNAFEPRDSSPPPSSGGGARFVCLDSFYPHKGHETLLKAAYILKLNDYEFTFDWHGEGPSKYELSRSIQRLGLDSTVHLKGKGTDLNSVYQNATALITASHFEGVGLEIMEAMGNGRPVVASDIPGNRESVLRETGFLCAVNDPATFAERMAWIIENPGQAREMGNAGWKIASERCSMDKLCLSFQELFLRALYLERSSQSFALRNRYRLIRSHLQCVA